MANTMQGGFLRDPTGALVVTSEGSFDGLPGILAPSNAVAGTSTSALTANTAYIARFVPVESFTATSIGFAVTAFSATDDPVDVGIYDAALNRLVSSGATTGR